MKYSYRTGIQKLKINILYGASSLALASSSIVGGLPLLLSQKAFAITTTPVCSTTCDADTIQAAINGAAAGDVISLEGNATINHELTITKSLTFNGNGHTIFSPFTETDTSNNAAIGVLGTSNVTFNDLTIDGTGGTKLHGINVYVSSDVALNNVTLKNNAHDGLVVNGSTVTVNSLATSANGWGGVDVDQGSGVTTPAVLTVNGRSAQTETAAIVADNYGTTGSVNDSLSQYTYTGTAPRIYTQKPTPAVSPAEFTTISDTANYYKGIDVGFSLNDGFGTLTGLDVSLYSGTTLIGTNTATNNMLAYYNNGGLSFTTPFVIQPGQYNPGSTTDGYWNFTPYNWQQNQQPTEVVITATGSLGTDTKKNDHLTLGGGTFASLFPPDTTAPATPTLLTPVNRGYEKTNDFYFNWSNSSDSGSPVKYEFQSSLNGHTAGGVLDQGVWNNIANGNAQQNNLTTPQIHSTGAPDGKWYWQVRAIDAAGNQSAWSSVWNVTIDTHAPATSINVEHATNGYVSSQQHNNLVTITGNASDNLGLNRVYVQLIEKSTGKRYGGQTVYLQGTTDSWQATVNTKNLGMADGKYYAVATVTDGAGNSTTPPFLTFTLDNTAPTGHATYTGGNKVGDVLYLKSINDLSYNITLHDENALEHTSFIVLKGDDNFNNRTLFCGNWNHAITSKAVSGIDVTLSGNVKECAPSTTWADGHYVIEHVVYDQAGNLTYFNAPYPGQKFIIDSQAPVVTDTNNFTVNMGTGDKVTLAPRVTGDSNVTYRWVVSNEKLQYDPTDTLSGSSLTIGPARPDKYTVTVYVTDLAGNVATQVYTVTITPGNSNSFTAGRGGSQQQTLGANTPAASLQPSAPVTETADTTTPPAQSTGKVKGAETTKPSTVNFANTGSSQDLSKVSNRFLGLGWWWIAVVAFVIGCLLVLFRRGGKDTQN